MRLRYSIFANSFLGHYVISSTVTWSTVDWSTVNWSTSVISCQLVNPSVRQQSIGQLCQVANKGTNASVRQLWLARTCLWLFLREIKLASGPSFGRHYSDFRIQSLNTLLSTPMSEFSQFKIVKKLFATKMSRERIIKIFLLCEAGACGMSEKYRLTYSHS